MSGSGASPWVSRVAAVLATALLGVTVGFLWVNMFPPDSSYRFFDLDFYRRALDAVAEGRLLYDVLAYPPVTLILLSPLRGLPEQPGNMLWTGASIITAVALAVVVVLAAGRTLPRVRRSTLVARCAVGATLLLTCLPMFSQLTAGQLTLLVIALTLLDAAGVIPRRLEGVGVGIASALKLTPLIFLPFYAITRQWRPLWRAAVAFVVTTGIGFALFPRDSLYFWAHPNSTDVQGPGRRDNVTALGVLRRWLADPATAQWIWLGLAAVLGVLAFWRARRHHLRGERMQAALVVGCASTVLAPIAWPHYQIWVALAALWLTFSGRRLNLVLGLVCFAIYSQPFAFAVIANWEASVGWRAAWELVVLVPILICVFGLPHEPPAEAGGGPEAAVPETAATVPA